jgi:hypothetical protein
MRARGSQLERFSSSPREKLYCNAQMGPRHIRAFCELSADCEKLLERAMATARAHDRILKVARTIADLEGGKIDRAQAHCRGHPVPHPRSHVLGLREKKWRTGVLARLASKHNPAHRSGNAKPFNISTLKSTIGAVYAKLQLSNGHFA